MALLAGPLAIVARIPERAAADPSGLALEHVELVVRLEPARRAALVTATLRLRNASEQPRERVELEFPAPLASSVRGRTAWDRDGELPLGYEPPADDASPGRIRIPLRRILDPGDKVTVALSYDLALEEFGAPDASLTISAKAARFETTGWYPAPAGAEGAPPRSLRLSVRAPREWQVEAPVKVRKVKDGPALAHYELDMKPVAARALLFAARAPNP